jgi:hypothetical protein
VTSRCAGRRAGFAPGVRRFRHLDSRPKGAMRRAGLASEERLCCVAYPLPAACRSEAAGGQWRLGGRTCCPPASKPLAGQRHAGGARWIAYRLPSSLQVTGGRTCRAAGVYFGRVSRIAPGFGLTSARSVCFSRRIAWRIAITFSSGPSIRRGQSRIRPPASRVSDGRQGNGAESSARRLCQTAQRG